MSTKLTIVYTTFLYYSCLLLLSHYILNCAVRKKQLICSSLAFVPLICTSVTNWGNFFLPVYIVFQVIQFPLIKLVCKDVKIRYLIFSYILLYCINMLLTSSFFSLIPIRYQTVDTIINTITTLLWVLACRSKIRFSIQQTLYLTPKFIMAISALFLTVASIMSVLIAAFQLSLFPEKWTRWIQIVTPFLLMAICIIVPVIFIISTSNARLKTLTLDYEQQIHAQAEHYKNLAEANYEVRRFRHDFQNIRIAIEKLLAQGRFEDLAAIIRQYSETVEDSGNIHALFDTGNGIADALLTDKQEKAINHNTRILFHGAIPPDSLSPTDLCVILGNSLDNALDACRKFPSSKEKIISVSCKYSNGFLFLTITNPIAEKVLIRNNHIATTKEDKTLHGFGLYSLHSIVKRYDGEVQLSATENSFTVSIDLCVRSAPKKAFVS